MQAVLVGGCFSVKPSRWTQTPLRGHRWLFSVIPLPPSSLSLPLSLSSPFSSMFFTGRAMMRFPQPFLFCTANMLLPVVSLLLHMRPFWLNFHLMLLRLKTETVSVVHVCITVYNCFMLFRMCVLIQWPSFCWGSLLPGRWDSKTVGKFLMHGFQPAIKQTPLWILLGHTEPSSRTVAV